MPARILPFRSRGADSTLVGNWSRQDVWWWKALTAVSRFVFFFSDSTTVNSVLDVRRRITAGLSVTVTKSLYHFIQISVKFNLTIGPILVGDVLERNYSQHLCPSKPRLLYEYRALPLHPSLVPRSFCVAIALELPLTTLPGMATK